jgi:glutathione S-transferase
MVLQLYGVPTSTCTQLVMTIFKETNTPFDLIDLNFMNGGTKAPEYVKMQPFGQIPVLVSATTILNRRTDDFAFFSASRVSILIHITG